MVTHHDGGAIVEKPEQMSVRELQEWLSRFGEKNRDHFEKNQVKRGPRNSIRHKIDQFDGPALSLSSSGSTLVASPPHAKNRDVTNRGVPPAEPKKQRQKEEEANVFQAALPIFREFDPEEEPYDEVLLENGMHEIDDMENYRVVSIQKVAHAPLPRQVTNSNIFPWDETDDFSDPWTSSSLQLKARRHDPVNGAESHCAMGNDSHSISTGRFTDPGIFRDRHVQAEFSKDNMTKTRSFRSKFPLLICKSQRGNDGSYTGTTNSVNGIKNDTMPESRSSAPLFKEHSFTKVASFFLPASDESGRQIRSILSDDDESTISLFTDESVISFPGPRELLMDSTANIGDVFTEELTQEQNSQSRISLLEMEPRPASTSRPLFNLRAPSLNGSKPDKGAPIADKPVAAVNSVVARFGGKASYSQKKSAVQLRREQLEQKWALDRAPAENMTRKVKWHSSNGSYKKKVTLDYSDNAY